MCEPKPITFKEKLFHLADKVAQEIYPLIYKFPPEERYCLGNQLRRAVVSIPANIYEGWGRKGEKELKQFLSISYGSYKEVKYLLYFAFKMGFVKENDYLDIKPKLEQLGKMLYVMIKKLR